MIEHRHWFAALLVVLVAPAWAVECPAARAMADGEQEMESRKEAIQRPEWLLMEFLASDKSKKSQKLFNEEVARSAQRVTDMTTMLTELTSLPEGTPAIPEEGTPACETFTRVRTTVLKLLEDRDAELKKYLYGDYKFIWGCDQIGVKLVSLGNSINKPDSKVRPQVMVMAAGMALGPPMMAARMKQEEFDALAGEMFQPSTLQGRTRYAYAGLRCLRGYQGEKIAPLAASSEALGKCDATQWATLGQCVAEATATKR